VNEAWFLSSEAAGGKVADCLCRARVNSWLFSRQMHPAGGMKRAADQAVRWRTGHPQKGPVVGAGVP